MYRILLICLCFSLLAAFPSFAQDKEKDKASDAKELSGMSIVGNDEVPKSLYIVPWKSSELGVETSLSTMLNEKEDPVDRDVFMRQLNFYLVSNGNTDR
jgi:hypothetical protein